MSIWKYRRYATVRANKPLLCRRSDGHASASLGLDSCAEKPILNRRIGCPCLDSFRDLLFSPRTVCSLGCPEGRLAVALRLEASSNCLIRVSIRSPDPAIDSERFSWTRAARNWRQWARALTTSASASVRTESTVVALVTALTSATSALARAARSSSCRVTIDVTVVACHSRWRCQATPTG